MTGTEARQSLPAVGRPRGRKAKAPAGRRGKQLNRDQVGFGDGDPELERLAVVELSDESNVALVTLAKPTRRELERLAAVLLASDALREMNELVPASPALFQESQL